jgi:hypothetical protein
MEGKEIQHTRLTALRLERIDSLVVKEPHTPVTFKLNLVDPLSDAQLNLLTLASPWKPMMVDAILGEWNERGKSFDAVIAVIETPSKSVAPKHVKKLRWGQVKRKRGFISHD